MSSFGLSAGSQFYFDVVSSYPNAAGQSAYGASDSISGYPAESDNSHKPYLGWNFYDAATAADAGSGGSTFGMAASEYMVASVPEPVASATRYGRVADDHPSQDFRKPLIHSDAGREVSVLAGIAFAVWRNCRKQKGLPENSGALLLRGKMMPGCNHRIPGIGRILYICEASQGGEMRLAFHRTTLNT